MSSAKRPGSKTQEPRAKEVEEKKREARRAKKCGEGEGGEGERVRIVREIKGNTPSAHGGGGGVQASCVAYRSRSHSSRSCAANGTICRSCFLRVLRAAFNCKD